MLFFVQTVVESTWLLSKVRAVACLWFYVELSPVVLFSVFHLTPKNYR